jgi:hypothetical protein
VIDVQTIEAGNRLKRSFQIVLKDYISNETEVCKVAFLIIQFNVTQDVKRESEGSGPAAPDTPSSRNESQLLTLSNCNIANLFR